MNLYVGNLPYTSDQAQLETLFGNHGEVDSARVITDRETGRSKGFGFVEMTNDTEARAAIEALNGTDIDGRNIVVNEARPRTERDSRGGGGGGGGFRGGNRGGGGGGGGGGGRRDGGRGGFRRDY
ncbi:MAG: RNA-binding protein [Lentisphaerae bacterium]|nr:RNA-binding protein [Lentisphaerota bacterium]MCP4100142.1 RNA-binding protein [Lentisphaerota bacterium]